MKVEKVLMSPGGVFLAPHDKLYQNILSLSGTKMHLPTIWFMVIVYDF